MISDWLLGSVVISDWQGEFVLISLREQSLIGCY